MKTLWQIVLLLALFSMAACDGNKQVPEPEAAEPSRSIEGPSSALSAIDSLMWQQPDSALTLLLPWFDTCRDVSRNVSAPYDRHYANLLLAELLYKNDYAQTNRQELQQAVAYFDSLILIPSSHTLAIRRHCGLDPQITIRRSEASQSPKQNDILPFLDARSHYINGVGYYEHDSVVEACKEYMKALEVMEKHFKEKELVGKKAKFMALTYTHLTGLFSDLYLHEQAIYFGKEALHNYYKYEASPAHIGWAFDVIGLHYDILNNFDSAYYYYNKGLVVLSDTNSMVYRDVATHLACLLYKKGGNATVSLNQLNIVLSNANNDREYHSRCLSIGEIYYTEKQFDSAWKYFNKVYDGTQSVESKKLAAERLVEICKTLGKEIEAIEYADFLVPFANQEENQSAIKSQLTEQYKYVGQRRQERMHQQEKLRSQRWAMVFTGIFLVLLSFIIILYLISQKRRQHLETQIEADHYAYKMQQAALAGRLKRSNADLKEQKERQTTAPPIPSPQYLQGVDDYSDEPICKHILAVCNDKNNPVKSTVPISAYANIALSDNQKAQLKNAAMRHYGQLFETLKQKYPELKDKDFFYCYLCLLGLDNVQIAVLQQKSISTIWDRESRLKKIFGSDDKVSMILHRLLNN